MSGNQHEIVDLSLNRAIGIAQFGELALKSEDLDKILTEACHLVGEVLGTDLAKVVELLEDGTTMIVRAGVGWKPDIVGVAQIVAAEGTSEGYCLRTGEPMISVDVTKETRFKYPPFLIEHGVRAIANVMIIGGQNRPAFGIFEVDSRVPRNFTVSDTLFLRSYANLIAAAVDRIRVTKEIRDSESRLQLKLKETVEKQTRVLKEAVIKRTQELTEANERLKAEAEERARVEEVLRQSMKMEAVGKLTGGLAHDFNNLLAVISTSLQMISRRISQHSYNDIGRYVESARASVARAAALTHRLLAFSRQQTLEPIPTDINKLIEGMRDIFSSTVGPGIEIDTKLAEKLWLTLCDPYQLENALLNVVINARDAMPDGGQIHIETANCILTDHPGATTESFTESVPNGEFISLFITDTGAGMPPSVVARAIDPFFTTKPLGKGTGLGLSMVYGYVQQSGGYFSLRSSVGQGTTVAIYLPRYREGDEGKEVNSAAAGSDHPNAGFVVLLVEDEPAARVLMAEILTEDGHKVLEADTGDAAMRHILSPARIDLLVTDIGLPGGINGRQLADAARQHRANLKVIFVTGYDEQAAFASGQTETGMSLLTKPFEIESLISKVNEVLGISSGKYKMREAD